MRSRISASPSGVAPGLRNARGAGAPTPAPGLSPQRDPGADLPGRAVAALERVLGDERRLQRMQVAGLADAFDGGDLVAVVRHRQRKARVDAPAVDDHGAGAALAAVAALL